MKYKKIQTTVKTDGSTSALQLGWVDSTRLDRDVEDERERFTRIALGAHRLNRTDRDIVTLEVAGQTIVAVYVSGAVRIINYVPEEEKP